MNRRTFIRRTGQAALAAAAAPLVSGVRAGEPLSVAAVGDCILTRKVSHLKNPRFMKLVDLLRSAHCTFGNAR
jgi:hypothetical protein